MSLRHIFTPLTAALLFGCGDGPASGSDDGQSTLASYGLPGDRLTLQEAAGGADCTVFRPQQLGAEPAPLPVIVWGSGTLANPSIYAPALSHLASRGFIVVAANTSNAGRGTEMAACLDWLTAEHARPGSPYAGHVDLTHVGASGHSQGGGGTLMFGRDPRVVATAPLEPYVQALFGHDPGSASQQRGPMLLLSGSNDTVAAPAANQAPVFDTSNVPTFWATLLGADHVQSATGDMSGFRALISAWFSLQLAGDEAARPLFYGERCAVCEDPSFEVQRKSF
jgi:predicted dienelactone hydrolase